MSTINTVIQWFAEGSLSEQDLRDYFEKIGLNPQVVNAYINKAKMHKEKWQKEQAEKEQKDTGCVMFYKIPGYSATPSGSLEGKAGK